MSAWERTPRHAVYEPLEGAMKLYPFGKGLHRARVIRAIKHAERNAARMLCLRWLRGEVAE